MSKDPQDFLARWSKRKQTAREDRSQDIAPEPASGPETPGDTTAEPPPDLPDIESLTKDSDFTVFLQDNVPEALRRQALRVLWRSDPVLANLDGLNDYDEDFSIVEGIAKVVRSNFKPGQGMRGDDDDADEPVADEPVAEAQDEKQASEIIQTASSDSAVADNAGPNSSEEDAQDDEGDSSKHD